MLRILVVVYLIFGCSFWSAAQHKPFLSDTATIKVEESPMEAPSIMADKWNQIHTRFFTMNIGLAIIVDHNITTQDANNRVQVGEIRDETEFRAERFILTGKLLFFKRPWRYMVSANYNGLDRPEGSKSFSFMDWNVEIPFGKNGGWLTFGKQKEGVGHEYVSAGSQMMFMERGSGAPAFIRQRNIGIRYSNSILNNRLTYTAGFFNNYWETDKSFSENGSQVTFRATGLPSFTSDKNFTHIGIGYRFSEATQGKLSYKAKPEVNTAPSFIKTDSFSAAGANTVMLELVKVKGPVSLVAEYMVTLVNRTAENNPAFSYWQAGASWFLTGESRRYNKQVGTLGKLVPRRNFNLKRGGGAGAFELAARYTRSNFNNENIFGGNLGRFTTAFSWYPNAYFRFEVNYGHGVLDRSAVTGKADFWQFRAQFEL